MKGKWLKRNIEESFFGQTKMEDLCFSVTYNVVKPMDSKIEEITNMAPHTSRK